MVPGYVSEPLDLARLSQRCEEYLDAASVDTELARGMQALLSSELGKQLLNLRPTNLYDDLINDAYKPKMHKLYAHFMQDVRVDFCLNIRKTPVPLMIIQQQEPALFSEFQQRVNRLHLGIPLTPHIVAVLRQYYEFTVTSEMEQYVNEGRIAPVSWQTVGSTLYAFASGTAASASNVESSLTQLVQELTIQAQVCKLQKDHGLQLDRTELLANALAHLVLTVHQLNKLPDSMKNIFCAKHLKGYAGTSAVYAVTKVDAALQQLGIADLSERRKFIGPLAGTHAHEVMSITAQLMADYDDRAGKAQGSGPLTLSAVLAHLLFLRANGGLSSATALCDTFGTEAFVSAAMACSVPEHFRQDMREIYTEEPPIPAGAKIFDLFKTWRLDSGEYEETAGCIMTAWEDRCRQDSTAFHRRPVLMNSNISSAAEALELSRLPDRIRPGVLAFGGLADGFLPFEADGQSHELKLASIVMKAVQAQHPSIEQSTMPCAGKIGDDADAAKVQVDPRLPKDVQQQATERMAMQTKSRVTDAEAASATLADMYGAVTRRGLLQGCRSTAAAC